MYIDSVILLSLAVIVMIIAMMVYIGRYAKRHIDMDEKEAKASYKHSAPLSNKKHEPSHSH